MTGFLTLLRAINCPLLCAGLLLLVLWLADTWPTYRLGVRLAWQGVVIVLIAGITGAAIKYLNGSPVDISAAIVTIGGLFLLAGMLIARRRVKP
jgi:hypothetical protein